MSVVTLIRKVGITEQTFYRWKKQYQGLESEQVREFKQPQEENIRLKQVVGELTLDTVILQDVLAKSFEALAETADGHVPLPELWRQRTTVVPDPPA